jgi:L-ascorbate metabolism protein UlaG (beta-lactamase superfamily)
MNMSDGYMNYWNIIYIFCFYLINIIPYSSQAQEISLEEIKTNLVNNPPNSGDLIIREETILALDNILKNDSSRTSTQMQNFYSSMMEKMSQELHESASTASIWVMYNHGVIIKTPEIIFAFDLVPGYKGWSSSLLPSEIISKINVLFINHRHGDHYNSSITSTVTDNGGYVVVPSEDSWMGNIALSPNDTLTLMGLKIKAHDGLHSVPIRIYEVTTPSGLKIVHTGDNQTSESLPEIDEVDILLLNAWVNESGSSSAVIGMKNSLSKLNPFIMIPGHIQELGHDFNPDEPASRVPYKWAFEVVDEPINSDVMVMAWGELYIVPDHIVKIKNKFLNRLYPEKYSLYDNYPNPFNPSTKIEFTLPKSEFVELKVYTILGEEIATVVDGKLPAGYHTYEFNGSNLASSVYLYKIEAGEYQDVKKMILLK